MNKMRRKRGWAVFFAAFFMIFSTFAGGPVMADNISVTGIDGKVYTNLIAPAVEPTIIKITEDIDTEPLIMPAPVSYEKEDFVTLGGTLTDEDGNTLAGFWINAFSEKTGYGNGTATDENGAFLVSVPKGEGYDLFIDTFQQASLIGGYFLDADGGSDDNAGADGKWNGSVTNDWESRTLLNVGENGLAGVSVILNSGSKISGKVIYSDGTPVKNLWINASADGKNGWGGASTDESGAFVMSVFPDEGYRISTGSWNMPFDGGDWKAGEDSPLTASGQDGTLTSDSDAATLVNATGDVEINIIVPVPAVISGRITDVNGNPVANVWVEALSSKPWDEKGTPEDPIFYIMDAVTDAEIVGETKRTAGDIIENGIGDMDETELETIIPLPKKSEKNTVSQVSTQNVNTEALGNVTDSMVSCILPMYQGVATDADGRYEIMVKPAADYRVRVKTYKTVYYKNASSWDDATPVDVSSESATGIDITADTGNTISGTVYGLAEGETGWIEAYSSSTYKFGYADVKGTGSPVTYTITMLAPADDYKVSFRSENYMPETRSGIDSSINPADVDFTVSEGETISGTITGAEPGQNIYLNVWNEGNQEYWGFAGVTADENGQATYEIRKLGRISGYMIQATAGFKTLFYNQKVSINEADKLDMSAGSAGNINFDFGAIQTVKITGTVAGLEEGLSVTVDAFSATSKGWGFAEVGENGKFTLEVIGGTYRINFYARGYMPVFYRADAEGSLTPDYDKADQVDVAADWDIGTLTFSDDYKFEYHILPVSDIISLTEDALNIRF